jgi:TonB-linked SusC/RagA family outer membrane protein
MERNLTFKMKRSIFGKHVAMKLMFFVLAGISLQLSAKSFSQTVSLSAKNEPLEVVFSHIEKQSGYTFFYKYNEVKNASKVTLELKNVPVEKAIEACLKGQPYSFAIEGRIIVIRKETQKTVSSPSAFISVSGKIVDETGMGIPNVTILLKGTKTGTSSDNTGNYKLTIPQNNGVLVFTSVGFVSQEIDINGQTTINVSMKPDSKVLEQVVVVGYGTQKRENLIGSVAQVSAKQLENRPVTQLSNALAGQMTGVTSIQRSGQPGANGSIINVRGVGSFGATSGALVIVDGIPGTLDDIDPNDVESISVLKDASSAAIYGARAANGVILVTTKTGKNQKAVISYNSYVGFQKPTALPEFADSWDYAAMYNEAEGSGNPTYTDSDIQKFRDGSDPDNYPNSNFIEDILSKNGLQTSHNFTVNGGTENTQYNVSMGYLFQDGLVIKNNYDRFNIRVNLKTALSSKFDLTTRLAGTRQSDLEPNTPTTFGAEAQGVKFIIGQAVRYPSNNAAVLSNGDFGTGIVQKGTPYSFLQSESFNSERGQKLNGNLRLDYKPVTGLKLSGIAGYNQTNGKRVEFLATQVINPNITLEPNNLTNIASSSEYYTLQGLAEYTKQFGRNNFSVLAGYSFEYNRFDQSSAFRDKLPNSNDLTQINAGASDNQQSTGSAYEWALESFFGRVNYSYASKYLVEGVIRRDGSSRFPSSHKYAYFPSAAVGYRIGQESFIKDNFSWINELKIKASFGILGNQNIPNYPYQNTYKIGTAYNYPFSSAISSGVARTTLTDPTLHWESTQTTDIGLDFAAFENKLTFSATYFDRYTYDILYSPGGSVSSTLGFTLSKQNTGKLSNKGWEFAVGHNNTIGGFTYGLNGNLSIINNKVLDLGVGNIVQPNGMVGNGSSLFNGYPMQIYYGYEADGIFVDAADVSAYAVQTGINPGVRPGDIRYKDLSGPDGVPDGKVDATYDRVVLGSNIPKYTFGLNISAAYKGFDFSMLLQGVAGVKNYMNGSAGYAFFNFGSIQKWQIDNRWTAENPNPQAEYPRLELITNSGTPNTFVSSFWTLDGSYLRGKNMQIGYTLPSSLVKPLKIASVRLYASGENLFLWSNYRKGWDPETGVDSSPNDDSNSVMTTMAYYPILRSYTFGVNIKF